MVTKSQIRNRMNSIDTGNGEIGRKPMSHVDAGYHERK